MPANAKFWIVWKQDDPRPPTKAHTDYDSAVQEAERLARKHRGRTFVVLEALATRTVDDMKRVELEAEPEPNEAMDAAYGNLQTFRDALRRYVRVTPDMSPLYPPPLCPLCDPDYPGDDLPF